MRKAAAIISAEKGLNVESHAKLQSLADREKLPDELFAEALTLLQDNRTTSPSLTHYEKAFVKFVDQEFGKISGDIISPKVEVEAIKLAKKKYDINGTRAQQLLLERAHLAGMDLISPQEALSFAERSIVNQIGNALSIDEEQRVQLFKFGKNWGLSESQVEKTIARHSSRNRTEKNRKLIRPLVIGSLLAAICAASAYWTYSSGWLTQTNVDNSEVEVAPNAILLENNSRFKDLIFQHAQQVGRSSEEINGALGQIFENDSSSQLQGYQQLVQLACSKNFDDAELARDLVSRFYFAEPSVEFANEIIWEIESYFDVSSPVDRQKKPFTVKFLKDAYPALSLLQKIARDANSTFDSNPNRIERKTVAKQALARVLLEPVNPSGSSLENRKSETLLANAQWNSLIQKAWANPTQSAAVLPALIRLTETKLESGILNSYREDAVTTILQTDPTQWRAIRAEMNLSIESCDEVRLNDWISIFESSRDQKFQVEVGKLLLPRLGVSVASSRHSVIEAAVSSYATQARNSQLRSMIQRSKMLDKFFEDIIEIESNSRSTVSPDRIAQLAVAVNIEATFCDSLENATHIDESSFLEFDRLIAMPPPRLQELISLPTDNKASNEASPGVAMASDKRRMDAAIDRLLDTSNDSTGLRILALKQLKQIAHRFDGISYAEARTIAKFMLSDLSREELTGLEDIVEAFSHWPNLTLAIADELPNSDAQVDQTLTLLRLLLGRELQIANKSSWKGSLQAMVLAAVAADVENRVDQDPDNLKSNWIRLEIFLTDAYTERSVALTGKQQSANRSVDQLAATMVKEFLRKQSNVVGDFDSKRISDIQRSLGLLEHLDINEIEKTAFTIQLLGSAIAFELTGESDKSDATKLISALETQLQTTSLSTDRLHIAELSLLKMLNLRRRAMVDELLKVGNRND